MSAGKISIASMVTGANETLTLHILAIDNNGAVKHFFQGPDGDWRNGNVPANPPQGSPQPGAFVAIKALAAGEAGVAFAVCALDSNQLLWFATADEAADVWGAGWQPLPPGTTGTTFLAFDLTADFDLGLVLVAISATENLGFNGPGAVFNGQADFRTFNDGIWQLGWAPPAPTTRWPYGLSGPIGGSTGPYPPNFSDISITDTGDMRNDDFSPLVSGVIAGVAMSLYIDPESGHWQWSDVPTVSTPPASIGNTPYPPPLTFCSLIDIDPFAMVLVGNFGLSQMSADPLGHSWTYQGSIVLPNAQAPITKVVGSSGFPWKENEAPTNALFLVSDQPGENINVFLLTAAPASLNWEFQRMLPGVPKGLTCVDLDAAVRNDARNLQVALLGSDGNVYINFQNAQGEWGGYNGATGHGLP